MVSEVSWNNQVQVLKDHSMWGGILLQNCVWMIVIYGFYLFVKFFYDLSFNKDFSFLWAIQNFSILGLITPFLTFWQMLFILRYDCDILYSIDDEGLESLSFLSYIGADEGGFDVKNNYSSSRFLKWQNVRKIKIYEKAHVIFVKGAIPYLPVTLYCTSNVFTDTVNIIKNHIDICRIVEFQ